jgi:hypothetical protein
MAVAHATLLTCAIVAALGVVRPAAAKPVACWTALLNDWYDGRIDKTYPAQCYRDALKHLPNDVEVYSTARTDIQRALANAIRANKNRKLPTGSIEVPPTKTATMPHGTTTPTTTTTAGGRQNDNGPVGSALGSASDSADSVPLPLIILGAFAVLLIGAGVVGVLVKRAQNRRLGGS